MNGLIPDEPEWYKCSNRHCRSYYLDWTPLPHQKAVLEDEHIFVCHFGAFGSAKTSGTRQGLTKGILLTPNGKTLIIANIMAQIEQTILQEFEEKFPEDFVLYRSAKFQFIDFINGHRMLLRPGDDPGKLRSLNLTQFAMIEASEIDPEVFTQLRTRLRNTAASVPVLGPDGNPLMRTVHDKQIPVMRKGWRKGFVESNPDSGFVKTELLLKADTIQTFGDVLDFDGMERDGNKNPDLAVIVSSSSCNPYLPPGYIQQISAGKPAWWISRFVNASFSYSEARVYPSAERCFHTETFAIPKTWKRIVAHDWGLVDHSIFLFAAIEPTTGIIWVYKCIRTNEKSIAELAALFKQEAADVPPGMWWTTPIIDPVSGGNRGPDKKSIIDLYLEYGLVWQAGIRSRPTRIFRLNTYMETGKLKIMQPTCPDLCEELVGLLFQKSASKSSGYKETPVDADDHSVVALEWITGALPENPSMLLEATEQQARTAIDEYGSFALTDSDNFGYDSSSGLYTPEYWQWSDDDNNTASTSMWLPL